MLVFGIRKSDFAERITQATENIVRELVSSINSDLKELETYAKVRAEVTRLRKELEVAKIEKDRQDETFARKEREIEHKVGLEKKRQEQELDLVKKEVALEAREKGVVEREKAFEDRMKFMQERFEAEVKYQRELLERMMKRLPSAEIIATLGSKGD